MLLYSKEVLTHFRCQSCLGWFSIADFSWEYILGADLGSKAKVWCPHCGMAHDDFRKMRPIGKPE